MNRREAGFSLIELLIVVTIIGIVAALAVPGLQKGLRAAENGNAYATMRTIASTQVGFFAQNNRFGRLAEINNILSQSLGTTSGSSLSRGRFSIDMVPATPTDAELRVGYSITLTRNVSGEGVIYQYRVTQSGQLEQLQP